MEVRTSCFGRKRIDAIVVAVDVIIVVAAVVVVGVAAVVVVAVDVRVCAKLILELVIADVTEGVQRRHQLVLAGVGGGRG
jgi:hypothetical protein